MICDSLSIAEIQERLDRGLILEFEKPVTAMITGSKGRRNIVKAAGLPWLLLKSNFDEDAVKTDKRLIDTAEKAARYSEELSYQKLKTVQGFFMNAAVICADTVVFNKKLLEKPRDEAEVYEMIRGLNGSKHQVITGVSIYDCRKRKGAKDGKKSRTITFSSVSEVLLDGVTDEKIAEMIKRENPYACSGGYTIDGLLGPYFKVLSGTVENVIGLPFSEVLEILSH